MEAAAVQVQWFNRLPAWLAADPAFLAMVTRNPAYLRVLQAVANRCDAPDAAGNLVGCIGSGRAMARAAGVHPATFWRARNALVDSGFLVMVSRGGTVRLPDGHAVNASCVYAVPGSRGALEAISVARERRLVRPGNIRGSSRRNRRTR